MAYPQTARSGLRHDAGRRKENRGYLYERRVQEPVSFFLGLQKTIWSTADSRFKLTTGGLAEDTDRMLNAGMKYGLRAKIHANELDYSGGIQVGVKYNALSVDHLEYVGDEEIAALKGSETMPTVLPGAAFFLNMPYSPVRKMINAGLPVALASDFNPGSSPSGNMKFVMSLGCVNYKMLPEEVINATTINSASLIFV